MQLDTGKMTLHVRKRDSNRNGNQGKEDEIEYPAQQAQEIAVVTRQNGMQLDTEKMTLHVRKRYSNRNGNQRREDEINKNQ